MQQRLVYKAGFDSAVDAFLMAFVQVRRGNLDLERSELSWMLAFASGGLNFKVGVR